MSRAPTHSLTLWDEATALWERPQKPLKYHRQLWAGLPQPFGMDPHSELCSERCSDGAEKQKKALLMGHIPREQTADLCPFPGGSAQGRRALSPSISGMTLPFPSSLREVSRQESWCLHCRPDLWSHRSWLCLSPLQHPEVGPCPLPALQPPGLQVTSLGRQEEVRKRFVKSN